MSNMEFKRQVDLPKDIRDGYPLTDDLKAIKQKNETAFRKYGENQVKHNRWGGPVCPPR